MPGIETNRDTASIKDARKELVKVVAIRRNVGWLCDQCGDYHHNWKCRHCNWMNNESSPPRNKVLECKYCHGRTRFITVGENLGNVWLVTANTEDYDGQYEYTILLGIFQDFKLAHQWVLEASRVAGTVMPTRNTRTRHFIITEMELDKWLTKSFQDYVWMMENSVEFDDEIKRLITDDL